MGSAGGQSMYGDEEELQKQMAGMTMGKILVCYLLLNFNALQEFFASLFIYKLF